MPTRTPTPPSLFRACWPALLLSLFVGCLFVGCQPDAPRTPAPTDEQMARRISQATSGLIAPDDPVRVRFVAPAADDGQVGTVLKTPVFAFDPPIIGSAVWEDVRTLSFRPNRPLPTRQVYNGRLDLVALFPGQDLAPLPLQFAVAGREVAQLDAAFVLLQEGDPRRVAYTGTVHFTQALDPAALPPAASLQLDGRPLPLRWQPTPDSLSFSFAGDPLQRTDAERRLVLRLDGTALDLSADFEQTETLAPLRQMQLQNVEAQDGLTPRAVLHFSDELSLRQDLRGLVTVEPPVELSLAAIGDQVIVEGGFEPGHSYELAVAPGIASRWGTRTDKPQRHALRFADLKPQLRFERDGAFLPSGRRVSLRFSTLNLRQVRLEIKKVFESNLGQFLQTERLDSQRDRRHRFNDYYVHRVGVPVAEDSLSIGDQRNRWLQHELDLSRLIKAGDEGLFLVSLRFEEGDMLYGTPEEAAAYHRRHQRRYDREGYHSNPYSRGYLHTHGRVYKPVALSDIGLVYKREPDGRHLLWATGLEDTAPLKGVRVVLRSYQDQPLAEGLTDARGHLALAPTDDDPFYIEARHNGQRALLKPDEMAWNLSTFETGGQEAPADGPQVFTYTERGVYRPGDPIHLALIARHADGSFPDDHPVELEFFNPRGQSVDRRTLRQGRGGFYATTLYTRPEDPTGSWRVRLTVGSRIIERLVKIETIVPFKLKTQLTPAAPRLTAGDTALALTLNSAYLFGTPAAGLAAEVDVRLQHLERDFKPFAAFSFTDQARAFADAEHRIFKGQLDDAGQARILWPLPAWEAVPSAVRAVVRARVFEKGGRPNTRALAVPIDPYAAYVGLRLPDLEYDRARVGQRLELPVVLVDTAGTPLAGRPLHWRIWRGTDHWWWEYDDRQTFQRRFRSDRSTTLVQEGQLLSAAVPVPLAFTPDKNGEYLIEVQDGDSGHQAALFVSAYAWGGGGASGEATLTLQADRPLYAPGDTAVVRFPTPPTGTALFTLERDHQVLQESWHPLQGTPEMALRVPLTAAMVPGVYASVLLLQPYGQTANDRPLRLYGVVPLRLEDPDTRQGLSLDLPPVLRPGEPFRVGLRTDDGRPTRFTLAVVDEGLLALTGFETPDPWEAFYRKRRLGVRSFDLFGHVIGAAQGDVFQTFSIGGDVPADELLGQLAGAQFDPDQRRRFEPVALFTGPLDTDAQGRASIDLAMPQYVGAVRAMAISADSTRYGHAATTVPVRAPLMLLPSLPRSVGPGDRFAASVSVFAMEGDPGPIEVQATATGPLRLQGSARQTLHLAGAQRREIVFALQADQAVGLSQIAFEARANGQTFRRQIPLEVRPSAPRIYASQTAPIRPDTVAVLPVPGDGLPGTNRARLTVRRLDYGFDGGLYRLLNYPYGCIEQVVSAAFPQLFLKDFLPPDADTAADIDAHINAAIDRLRRFQLPDGSFGYWPGDNRASPWGGLYAGHFLTEATALGYRVPADLTARWQRYETTQASAHRESMMERVYRVYVLALAGQPAVGAANLLRENHLAALRPVERWLLAAAYHLAGDDRTAADLARGASIEVAPYRQFAQTYGSDVRDKGLMLDAAVTLGRTAAADSLAGQLALVLRSDAWYSTQETAVVLLALGKYLKGQQTDEAVLLQGSVTLPDGRRVDFSTDDFSWGIDIEAGFGGQAKVRLDADSGLKRAFATLAWDGVPLKSDAGDMANNLVLEVEWRDEDGRPLDPRRLVQGTAFWGHYRVKNPGPTRQIEELALAQLLPAGWEVDNIRLSGEDLPTWMRPWKLGREDYLDLRDAGAAWFFDLDGVGAQLDFAVKLTAVTPGTYTLPPTTVQAMYDRSYMARRAGEAVEVVARP